MLYANLTRPRYLAGFAATAALTLCVGQTALAGPITATYLGAGAQTPNFPTACSSATSCFYGTESFSNWAGSDFNSAFNTGTSNFTATNYINGVYSSNGDTNWKKVGPDQYGGANGTSPCPVIFGNSSNGDAYGIKLSHSANIPGVNYFGLWISAMDPVNDLQFYSNGQLLYTFGSQDLQAALGTCSSSNTYCGNPTTPFKGQNAGELYAYVNFFDTVGYFDQVVLADVGNTGFESTNHSVAYINPLVVSGTTFNAPDRPPSAAFTAKIAVLVPEPATVMLVFTALVVLLYTYYRRRTGQVKAELNAPDGKKEGRRRRRSRSRTRPAQIGWPSSPQSRFSS